VVAVSLDNNVFNCTATVDENADLATDFKRELA
jgi:hypothetical protein